MVDLIRQSPSGQLADGQLVPDGGVGVIGAVLFWNGSDAWVAPMAIGPTNGQHLEWDGAAWTPTNVIGAVTTVFTRAGNVVAVDGDYAATQITNDSGVAGDFVDDALDQLNTDIGSLVTGVSSIFSRAGAVTAAASDYDASEIDNDSNVPGDFVDDALNNLVAFASTQMFADQFGMPNNASFAVNALAPSIKSLNDPNVTVRPHSASLEEGVYFELRVPDNATHMTLRVLGAADVAPGGAAVVILKLYLFDLSLGSDPGPWTSELQLPDVDIPTDNFPVEDTFTDTLAGWGLTAGVTYQWEITRDGTDGADTLNGSNWDLMMYEIIWSN